MLGIQIFAVAPAIEVGRWQVAAQWGALFGFFCYMTYDLTNQATLKVWPVHSGSESVRLSCQLPVSKMD